MKIEPYNNKQMKDNTMNNVKNYIIRRSGQLIGTYTNKDQAFSDKLINDNVFEVVETRGEYGCIREHKIDNK